MDGDATNGVTHTFHVCGKSPVVWSVKTISIAIGTKSPSELHTAIEAFPRFKGSWNPDGCGSSLATCASDLIPQS
jgi:hypothetical protein